MVFAERLRERRRELGMTVSQCAAYLHKTQPAWTLYETGKRLPKLDELLEICRLLATTPNDLLGVSLPSSSITVTGNGNAVSQGSGASARAVSWKDFVPGAVAGKPGLPAVALAKAGELPQCARCPHRKLADKMRKMLGGG